MFCASETKEETNCFFGRCDLSVRIRRLLIESMTEQRGRGVQEIEESIYSPLR